VYENVAFGGINGDISYSGLFGEIVFEVIIQNILQGQRIVF
jgi:hypothetical protein